MIKYKDLDRLIAEAKLYVDQNVHSGVQPWSKILADLKASGENKDPETEAREVYADALGTVTKVERKLSRLLKRVAVKDAKILIDIKKEDAFIGKVVKRGKAAEKITDVLRSTILVKNQDELDKLIANIEKYATIYEHEVKNEHEDEEYGYYGSHHFLIVIDDVLIELQAMTKRLGTYKTPAHDIYTKWRSVDEFDNDIAKKEKQQSKILFKKGNKSVIELEAGERSSKYKQGRQGKFAQKTKFTN